MQLGLQLGEQAAVAALAINTLKKTTAKTYAFIGLGNTARATFAVLAATGVLHNTTVRLWRYKNQAEIFIRRFESYADITFEVHESPEEIIKGADVVVSCVTAAETTFAPDECFDQGVLVVPVHTRGFQNCDLFFDKVIVDDIPHVKDFKYFDKFNGLAELTDVLYNPQCGRTNDNERILAYNIGLAISDIYFASKLYDIINNQNLLSFTLEQPIDKFWI